MLKSSILLNIILVGLLALLYSEINLMEGNQAKKILHSEFIEIVEGLKIPNEVLYYDHIVINKINNLRKKSYEEFGISKLVFHQGLLNNRLDHVYDLVKPEHNTYLHTNSFENINLNKSNSILGQLLLDQKNKTEIGKLFHTNNPDFNEYAKPLLLRILSSSHPWHRIKAVEILLNSGVESEKINEVLSSFIAGDKFFMSPHITKHKEPSAEQTHSIHLAEKFNLSLPHENN